MKPKIIVYLPVIHHGYLDFFSKYPNVDIFIINQDLIELIDQEFDYLRKEIRAIKPAQAEISLESLLPNRNISLISAEDLSLIDNQDQQLILPNEDIFIWLAKKYLSKAQVKFDTTFLRWNRENSVTQVEPVAQKTGNNKNDSNSKNLILDQIKNQVSQVGQIDAELSSDWWRQVGAVVFKEEKQKESQPEKIKLIDVTHNHHLPSPYTPYIDSDPRNSFHKGEKIDLSTAIHAESAVIANCAKNGTALADASIYVTTFPCPVCAKLIAKTGIKKLYFSEGYAMLDGEKILNDAKIEIIKL